MSDLEHHIRDLIEIHGPISIADFMSLALQHPEHGYYRRHDPLGCAGDFITAPEISQMFGEMIGLWCAKVWHQMGMPEQFIVFELGPGRGTLMKDALRATANIAGFHQAMQIFMLESNSSLRDIQQGKLENYALHYVDRISQLPQQPILVIANEFFDALPIRQYEQTPRGWRERLVGIRNDHLCFVLSDQEPCLSYLPESFNGQNSPAIYEVSPESLDIVSELAQHIARYDGAALIVDYGFEYSMGQSTFQALSKHKYVDVLSSPGDVDLTAHVDFGALRNAALQNNICVSKVVGQGKFLKNLGIELRANRLKNIATPEQVKTINSALDRLLNDDQMGCLFKVMAISSPQLSMFVPS